MSFIFNNEIKYSDSSNLDAFGRLRVSNITTLIDIKHNFDKLPLLVNEAISGTATSVFSKEFAKVIMNTNGVNDYVIRESKSHAVYQAGKGQLFEASFCSFEIQKNIIKRVGGFTSDSLPNYNNSLDGFFLESNGVTGEISFNIFRSGSTIYNLTMANWNNDIVDPNDIDWSLTQLLFVDYQWLGVGRVRFGLVLKGKIVYFGESNGTNNLADVYMSSPNKPIRYDIHQVGSGTGSFEMICSQISTEGALNALFSTVAVVHSATTTMSTSGQKYPYIGYRLKPDYSGIKSNIDKISILNTSNDNYVITAEFNPVLSTSVTWFNIPNSPFEYALANGTPTITSNGFILDSIIGQAGTSALTSLQFKDNQIVPNTRLDGTKDELWICIQPLGANATFNGTANILYYL